MFSLDGYLMNDAEAILEAVTTVLQEKQYVRMVAEMARSNGSYAGRRLSDVVNQTLESLAVEVLTLETSGNFVANVYMDPPTRSIAMWKEYLRVLSTRSFSIYKNRVGKVRSPPFKCPGCKGADHPAHLCVFTRMRGWKGPPAMSEEMEKAAERRAADDARRAGGHGQGNETAPPARGGWRGRGGQTNFGRGGWQPGWNGQSRGGQGWCGTTPMNTPGRGRGGRF